MNFHFLGLNILNSCNLTLVIETWMRKKCQKEHPSYNFNWWCNKLILPACQPSISFPCCDSFFFFNFKFFKFIQSKVGKSLSALGLRAVGTSFTLKRFCHRILTRNPFYNIKTNKCITRALTSSLEFEREKKNKKAVIINEPF